jgi:hypothetical protein
MYGWEESYKSAMLETDRSKLPERIDATQTSINRRLQEINAGHDSREERYAIRDAMAGLNVLKRLPRRFRRERVVVRKHRRSA